MRGGPVEYNADLIQEMFQRMNDYLRRTVVGTYVIPFCTTPAEIEPRAMETARKMARDLNNA